MPRPPSPLWEHFGKEMPNKRATCNYCGLNMCGLVIRMRMHLARKCTSCPDTVKAKMSAEIGRKHEASTSASAHPIKKARTKKDQAQSPAQAQAQIHTPEQAVLPTPAPAPAQPTVHEEVSTASPPRTTSTTVAVLDDKSDLDGYVARAIFGAGLPVATVEHSAFVKMLKRMNPAYDPPSAFVLATSVLDLEYSEVQIKLRAEVLDSTASIQHPAMSKREMFEKIQSMSAKYMSEDQACKAAVVYLNSNLASNVEDGVANTETLV
ncbi:hypothetical protein PHYPSEUDO_011420 [Phytophthora pseudosyringae]|uniref:BED-type domain-containing protein n=1 Tax=Phytophthora pseudosyringae TaxID=221518 RepID=A0A8T1VDJ8_9STRA|nr:hypothetical protein PHYPSEUDO_011420 [Phytophthora pseudosyringae]